MWTCDEMGPCFGANCDALNAMYEPFNLERACKSASNDPGFANLVGDNGKNMLTNKEDGKFTITELEVWEVTE